MEYSCARRKRGGSYIQARRNVCLKIDKNRGGKEK